MPGGRERLFDGRRIARMTDSAPFAQASRRRRDADASSAAAQRAGPAAAVSRLVVVRRRSRSSFATRASRRSIARTCRRSRWRGPTTPANRGDLQTQPVVVGDILYAYSPTQRVLALEAATGKPVWTFDAKLQGRGPNRGVMYWPAATGERTPRTSLRADRPIIFTRSTRRPARRSPNSAPADGIDLRQDLGRRGKGPVGSARPPPARSTRTC